MISVLIRRGDEDTDTQRNDHVRTQREDDYLQVQERDLRRNNLPEP